LTEQDLSPTVELIRFAAARIAEYGAALLLIRVFLVVLVWGLLVPAHATPAPVGPGTTLWAQQWKDADDAGSAAAEGSVDLCETIAAPLGLIPNIGTALDIAAEIGCLIPGAVAADYIQREHGQRKGWLWQGFVALGTAKLWRLATRWISAAVILGGVLGVVGTGALGSGVLALTVWPVAPLFLPVIIAGAVTAGALGYVLVREARKHVQERIFQGAYGLLSSSYASANEQRTAQESSLLRPRLNMVERLWFLAAFSQGLDGQPSKLHWIPVAGPVLKAAAKIHVTRGLLRRVSAEELGETRVDWRRVDAAVAILMGTEAVLASLAHVALATSVVLVGMGVVAAALQFPFGMVWPLTGGDRLEAWKSGALRGLPLAVPTGAVGFVALASAATSVGLIALREIPKALQPILIPLAYGVLPDGDWFPSKNRKAANPKTSEQPAPTEIPGPLTASDPESAPDAEQAPADSEMPQPAPAPTLDNLGPQGEEPNPLPNVEEPAAAGAPGQG
jgi:hypothetical protein